MTFTTTDVGYGANLFYYLRSTGTSDVPEAETFWAMGTAVMTGVLWRFKSMRRDRRAPAATDMG
jgi:hypothetical protein